jgi:NADH dehydrogenase [ubiquinone] 1 alpha subcomplex assembly factor 7
MRSLQQQKLGSRQDIRLHWHNSIAEIEPSAEAFTFLVAHEFFDALPVYVIRVSPFHRKQTTRKKEDLTFMSD